MAMIAAHLTGDGTCADCGAPAPKLPARAKRAPGAGAYWRYCTACHLNRQGLGCHQVTTEEERQRQAIGGSDDGEGRVLLSEEFRRRMGDE